jgi:hypothetical protein
MIKKVILSLVCVGISAIFIRAGTFPFSHGEGPQEAVWFGITSIVYGAGSIALLLAAWKTSMPKIERYQRYLSGVFLVLLFVVSMDVGRVSGLEIGSLLIAGLLVYVSWYSIKSVQAA